MKRITLAVLSKGGRIELNGERDEPLLDVINREPALALTAPCGGKGRCGKCRVRIVEGSPSEPSPEERRILSGDDLGAGIRLACRVGLSDGMEITLPGNRATVQTRSNLPDIKVPPGVDAAVDPLVRSRFIRLPQPSIEDQRSDEDRLSIPLPPTLLRLLPDRLRASDFGVTLVETPAGVCDLVQGELEESIYGAAVDIGTTTLVLYLVDLGAGRIVSVASMLNPQGAFGADVISRIDLASSSREGLALLGARVTAAVAGLLDSACASAGVAGDRVYGFLFAGNTTMLHLLLGVPPTHIAAAPFTPAFLRSKELPAAELGLGGNARATAITIPGISGYVGADITAAVLASGMTGGKQLCCLIDIGTNGEIVLGNSDSLVCCSTAAGPAFEGAQLRCGIGGVGGAVNAVVLGDVGLELTTIADEPPAGLCGSGVADILAILLEAGIVDETGRFAERSELAGSPAAGIPAALLERIVTLDGQPAFVVADQIVLTQKDVREIQLAKAAIAAGIRTLMAHEGVTASQIRTLYVAGGFGSYLRKESAAAIGLIPRELVGKTEVIGNGAGKGAVMGLISRTHWTALADISRKARYLELSSSAAFQEAYVEEMIFPGKKADSIPRDVS